MNQFTSKAVVGSMAIANELFLTEAVHQLDPGTVYPLREIRHFI